MAMTTEGRRMMIRGVLRVQGQWRKGRRKSDDGRLFPEAT